MHIDCVFKRRSIEKEPIRGLVAAIYHSGLHVFSIDQYNRPTYSILGTCIQDTRYKTLFDQFWAQQGHTKMLYRE